MDQDPSYFSSVMGQIYETNLWKGDNSSLPRSGPGSRLECTVIFRDILREIIRKDRIKRVVDLGCGDLTWMKTMLPFFEENGVSYLGCDVAQAIISEHQQQDFGPNVAFRRLDILHPGEEGLPQGDLYVLRDILFHLSNENIFRLLGLLRATQSKILVSVNQRVITNEGRNVSADQDHWAAVDLRRPPFNLLPLAEWVERNKRYQLLASDQLLPQ